MRTYSMHWSKKLIQEPVLSNTDLCLKTLRNSFSIIYTYRLASLSWTEVFQSCYTT